MVLELLSGDRPTLHRVALFAVRSHLPAVNIALLMAVRAILPDIVEDGIDVALDAPDFLVHTPEGIVGFVVIKLRNGPNRPPTRRSVTVLTGYCQRAVRIASGFVLGVAGPMDCSGVRDSGRLTGTRQDQQGPKGELE